MGFVEPMLRRRLSFLAKISLKLAHDCAFDQPSVRFVYATRHGDLARTAGMLDAVAEGETPSPTAFSLAVPNAAAGLFSILRRDAAPATTVSAANSSFGCGLIEAALQYAENPSLPVLLVYADEPTPEVFGVDASEANAAHAAAILLSERPASRPIVRIECRMAHADGPDSEEPQSLAFIGSLPGGSGAWSGEGRRWTWGAC